jgi:hypothetical protein
MEDVGGMDKLIEQIKFMNGRRGNIGKMLE